MIQKISIFLFILLWAPLSHSAKVGKIGIKGNRIIETSLIRSHIRLKKGSTYSERKVQQDVRQLFSLGFFDDVIVRKFPSKDQLNLVYEFKERSHIGRVEFKGNKGINKEDLKELSTVQEYGFLNFNDLQDTLSAIREKYREKGYYLADVSYQTKKIPGKKQLKLIINIKENDKLFVKRVHFIGNRNVSEKELKPFMMTKEQNFFSFMGSSGTFKPKSIERDLQFIDYYYRDKGYLNVRIHEPEITITPDQKFVYIGFPLSEGPRFKVGQVAFRSAQAELHEKLNAFLSLKEGEYFSLGNLQKDIQSISLFYKNKGYAFVKVQPQFFPDPADEEKIHILFQIERGKIHKLRRIHLEGNHSTRDKVILRRVRLKEGEIYNESKKTLSQQLLQQLGYFEQVDIRSVPADKRKNQMDLLVRVKERENTGEAHLAGGYNSQSKLFIQGGVKKQNFLGLDHSVSLNLNFSKYDEILALSYQSPYFLDSHWNFAFDLFNVGRNTLSGSNLSSAFSLQSPDFFSYFQLNTGGSFSLGRHLTKFFTVFLKYKLQNQLLEEEPVYFLRGLPVVSSVFDRLFGKIGETQANEVRRFGTSVNPEQAAQTNRPQSAFFSDVYELESANGLNSSLSAIMEYDARNDRYYASRGFFTRLSAEYSGLGGDFNYTKLRGDLRYYYNPFWKLVIKNKLEYGFVFPNTKSAVVPFTELFLLGGPYNLRGFRVNTQGPKRRSQQAHDYAVANGIPNPEAFAWRPYGGPQMFFYSLELEFPFVARAELRGALFFDIGEVNDRLAFNLEDQLRANVGVGIRWRSPMGPISLDWAWPYKAREKYGEQEMEFQFSIGSQF